MANPNYDEILSTTLAAHRESFTDNVFKRRPLAFYLKDNGRVKMKDGGHKIVMPIMLTTSNGGGSYTGYDTLSLATSDTGTAAEFTWKQYQQPITIDGLTEFKNSGVNQLIDLLEAKVNQAEDTMIENLNTMWFGDGTGNGGKDMNGLGVLIGDESDAITTVGGIDCSLAANATWRSGVYRSAGTFSGSGTPSATVNGINKIRTAMNTATRGTDKVDLILTDQSIYEAFEAQLNPLTRYEDVKAANAGFENFTYKSVPIMWDEQIPTQYLTYGINTKHLNLIGGKGRWFYNTPFETTPDKDAKWAHVLCYGNMVTDSRRHHFRIEFSGA